MNWRILLLIVVAIGAAVASTQYARNWLESQREQVAQQPEPEREAVPTDQVLVAAKTLETGTILQPDDLRWTDWPRPQVQESYLVEADDDEGLDRVTGAVVRQRVSEGTPLVPDMYLEPGEKGFLSAILEPGKRAMSVRVNNAATLAGLVFPGDRVDLILSHSVEPGQQNATGGQAVEVTETVMRNMKILAMDQRTGNPDNEPQSADIATLEATPKQARQLVMAERLGQIRFSLRSIADGGAGDDERSPGPPYTLAHEVSALMRASKRPPDADASPTEPAAFTVEIVRGGQVQTRTFGGSAPPEPAPE